MNVMKHMGKDKKEKVWLSTQAAIQFLKDRGKILTPSGLKYVGIVLNFVRKTEDGFHLEYSQDGLEFYLESLHSPNPKKWISLSEISEQMKKSISWCWEKIQKYKIETIKHMNNLYINREQFMIKIKENYTEIDNRSWITVSELALQYKISLQHAYLIIRRFGVKTTKRVGVMYAHRQEFDEKYKERDFGKK